MSEVGFQDEALGVDRADDEELDEKKEELIEAVKERKILYDPGSVSNRNTFLKEKAWKAIGNQVKMTDLWCKSEWTKLRNTYAKKKKALVGKTGQRRKKIEAWPHFFAMKFLDDYSVTTSTSGNVPLIQDEDQEVTILTNQGELDAEDSAIADEPSQPSTPIQGTSKDASTLQKSDQREVNKEKCITYSAKRSLKRDTDKVDAEIVAYLSEKRAKLDNKPNETDGHHHFGLSVASSLRKMTDQTASFVKMKIMQVIYEAEVPPVSHDTFDIDME